MRENPFYVDTVRAFRDRRYEYKGLLKKWQGSLREAMKSDNAEGIADAKKMIILFDSLQLAHKCILNSFYGYVMRKGSRWSSMEMAGIVTHTGANIIKEARQFVEQVGRPLELDTDGIWCMLPASFPENFEFKFNAPPSKKKNLIFSYPCVLLNKTTANSFTNHQYQTRDPVTGDYETRAECSIFFEVDGPYKAMVLPASTEEDKKLKKRYAVFFPDGSLAELKGFELKRRGELKLIKIYQSQIFENFLHGSTLEECYEAVSKVANHWLDVLYQKGASMADDELLDLISSSSTMSKALSEYDKQKSNAICTAKRLSEFLGGQMVAKKGLACRFIIARKPAGRSVAERAIPVAIFAADEDSKRHYIRKWTADPKGSCELRDIVDWDYYINRLGSAIQKIITIPAALQKVKNPVPRVRHPDWLLQRLKDMTNSQQTLKDTFSALAKGVFDESVFAEREEDQADMKMMVAMKGKGKGKDKISKFMRKRQPMEVVVEREEDLGPMPDERDHQVWLAWMKRKWCIIRERKRKRKEHMKYCLDHGIPLQTGTPGAGSAGAMAVIDSRSAKRIRGVGGYLNKQASFLNTTVWQIVQIVQTDVPGELKLWVLLDNQMHDILLVVNRVLYLNSAKDGFAKENLKQKNDWNKVQRALPHQHEAKYLYEVKLDEGKYQRNQRQIMNVFTQDVVLGVYESKLDIVTRALMEVGCMCSLTKEARYARHNQESKSTSYDLAELRMVPSPAYMTDPSQYMTIYIYFSHVPRFMRGVMGIFSSLEKGGDIVVLNTSASSRNAKRDMEANINRIFKNKSGREVNHIYHVSSMAEACTRLDTIISEIKERVGPAIVLWHSTLPFKSMAESVPVLSRLPSISIPANESDNNYPALQWEAHASQYLVSREKDSAKWLTRQLLCARYAHVPVGNMEADHPVFLADIIFARLLRSNNCVLWWADSVRPDLGQVEEDDNTVVGQMALQEFDRPEICVPKVYTSVTVELNVRGLAVNTILQHAHLATADTSAASSGGFSNTSSLQPAFTMVKVLLSMWLKDATAEDEFKPLAEMLVDHCYRWLTNPYSHMYDPSLHHLLHGHMKKVYSFLVNNLRHLGATIVYASFNRMIISTGKDTVEDAEAYCEYILAAISKLAPAEFVDLEVGRMWEILIFMDNHNYGGVPARKKPRLGGGSGVEDIVANWNIGDYLPLSLQEHFLAIIGEYIQALHDGRQEDLQYNDGINAKKERRKLRDEKVTRVIVQRLMAIVEDMPALSEQVDTPEHRIMSFFLRRHPPNPALELTKFITHILSLDERIADRVHVMRVQVFRLLNVGEYSPESEFVNPCPSYILSDTVCTFCSNICDLDLLRDSMLLAGRWACQHCRHPFDKKEIELRLVNTAQQLSMAFQMQVQRESLKKK